VNPADLYTTLMGGRYGPDQRDPPFVAGHDGIGVVLKVTALIFWATRNYPSCSGMRRASRCWRSQSKCSVGRVLSSTKGLGPPARCRK